MSQLKAQVDKLLTNVSSGYFPKNYISEQILPMIQVAQYTGLLGKYGTAHLRIENSVKGGRGKYRQVETRQYSTTSFNIEGHGLTDIVTDADYRNVEKPFDAEKDTTLALANMLWLEKEKMLADTLSNTAVMTQNVTLAGTDQWSDYANSDPLDDIETGHATILNSTGQTADTAIMSLLVKRKLRYHPQLLDALGFKFDRPGGLKDQELAEVLDVKRILIGDAYYESAKEGQASALAPVWGKHVILAVCPESAQIMQQSLGYMVRLTGTSPRKTYKQAIFNPPGSTEVLVEDEYDMLMSNVLAGYLIKNAIA